MQSPVKFVYVRPLPSPTPVRVCAPPSLSARLPFTIWCVSGSVRRIYSAPPALPAPGQPSWAPFPLLYIRQGNRQGGSPCCLWSLSRSPQMPSAAAAALLLQYVAVLLRLFPLLLAPLQLRFGAEPWLCNSLAGLDAWQPSGQLCSLLFVWKAAAAAAKRVGAWEARGLIDSDVHQWVFSF